MLHFFERNDLRPQASSAILFPPFCFCELGGVGTQARFYPPLAFFKCFDDRNIFLWHKSEDINQTSLFPKFQLIPILRIRFQVMHGLIMASELQCSSREFTSPLEFNARGSLYHSNSMERVKFATLYRQSSKTSRKFFRLNYLGGQIWGEILQNPC